MSQQHDVEQLVISVKNVGVAYKRQAGFFRKEKFWALKDVSFDVYHGETLGVIGRNGVGKSTLLKLIANIISPDTGKIINNGVTATMLSLQVGFIQHLTGRENSILSGMMLGLSKNEVLAQMDNIRTYADIGDFFDQPVYGYSMGMRARLGFSIAIYVDPDIILLDELLGVGDADFRQKSTATMRNKINGNKTIILVSHNMKVISETCDRVIWLNEHRVKMVGVTKNVLEVFMSENK